MRLRHPAVSAICALATVAVVFPAAGAAGAATSTNLVVNPGFTTSTSSWYVEEGAAVSLTTGVSGKAARVTATRSGDAVLNDGPDTVLSSQKGATYTATAYVRSAAAGTPVTLRLTEYVGKTVHGRATSPAVEAGGTWRKVTVTHTAKTAGSRLSLSLASAGLVAGRSFDVDNVSLRATTGTGPTAEEPTAPEPVEGWTRIYRNDFSDLRAVNAFNSSKDANNQIRSSDSSNGDLQKPTVRSNVEIMNDGQATDGKAMGVWTRMAAYPTSSGTKTGWANGRMSLKGQDHALPIRISTRIKLTRSMGAKAAVMWWPAGGGWPWEVDFVETFGGKTMNDYWGSRQNIAQRWHADLNGDRRATEQLLHDDKVDGTKYHVYDLYITAGRMWIEIDGRKTFETTDRRFIPKGEGFFTVGKALTGVRSSSARSADAVIVDYIELYKPSR